MKILVTDGENRSALAVTRSLGMKGFWVGVLGKSPLTLASCSRYCAQGLAAPSPLEMGEAYRAAIRDISYQHNIDIIIPLTEASIYRLNSMAGALPGKTILACPPSEKMNRVTDKAGLFRLAEELHVPIPETLYLEGAADLPSCIDKIDRYPVVVKPALSKIPVEEGFLDGKIQYATSRKELEALYDSSKVLQYPSMIQEKINGPGTGLFLLFDTDTPLALFSHRRIREKPPSGGISVVSESVALDRQMVKHATNLLEAVGWKGVAMVEFKRDRRDGKAKLMEINGRFWGTLQLAVTCGVDFPALLIDLLQGCTPPAPVKEYKTGHKMKWFLGTLDHLLIRLKNSDKNLTLPPQSHSKCGALRQFFEIWEKNTTFDVFDRKDLRPFLFETYSYIRDVFAGAK